MVSLRGITGHSTGAGNLSFSDRCKVVNERALKSGYLERLFPDGKRVGRELTAADVTGGRGRSFSANLDTGQWGDFAGEQKGGDLVSLLAARDRISLGEALELLEKEFGALPEKPQKNLPPAPTVGRPTKAWVYTDENGRPLYEARRWELTGHRKSCRPVGLVPDAPRVPLHLPEVLKAIREKKTVFIVEGEPKVDLLRSWGLTATTFINGVNGYKSGAAKWFAGGAVVILPDADEPGQAFGRQVAADVVKAKAAGVKLIELPGARFQGYDVVDWQEDGGTFERLAAIVEAAPLFGARSEESHRPFQVDPWAFSGRQYLAREFKEFDWMIEKSFRRGQLGLICGPPGCGKGFFSLQLAVALAAGRPAFDFWEISRPNLTMFISSEDDQDELHRRLYRALHRLPNGERDEVAGRVLAVPVRGRITLTERDRAGSIRPTINFDDLKSMVDQVKPDLLILDTLARIFGIDENDNPSMTEACGLLEEIIEQYGCNIIVVHHTSKMGGDRAADKNKLKAALVQTAIRGASALVGCVRWALLMAPMDDDLAGKIFGSAATGKHSGSFLAARVAKKNAGGVEGICYMERDRDGLLDRVLPLDEIGRGDAVQGEGAQADAHMLAAEVDRRRHDGQPRLSVTTGGTAAFGWGRKRSVEAARVAVELGLLMELKNDKGKGSILVLPSTAQENEPLC